MYEYTDFNYMIEQLMLIATCKTSLNLAIVYHLNKLMIYLLSFQSTLHYFYMAVFDRIRLSNPQSCFSILG